MKNRIRGGGFFQSQTGFQSPAFLAIDTDYRRSRIVTMSLDVYIQSVPRMPTQGDDHEYVCSLDDDGYYWFLFPLFEDLCEQTGQRIDLYDGAIFGTHHLDALNRKLDSARQLAEVQPNVWNVVTGNSSEGPIIAEVRKAEMLQLMDKLTHAVNSARSTNRFLLFFGD